jgi:hypothetical protein
MLRWHVYYEPVENQHNADLPEVCEYLGVIPALFRSDAEEEAVERLRELGCDVPKEDLSVGLRGPSQLR